MLCQAVGNCLDPRLGTKKYGDAAGPAEDATVKLQPARRATARQPSIGHSDVHSRAGLEQRMPVNPLITACREDMPFTVAAPHNGSAGVARARTELRLGKGSWLAVETRCFADQRAHIVAAPLAQHHRRSISSED